MVVRGRTLPELTSGSNRSSHSNNRSDLSKSSKIFSCLITFEKKLFSVDSNNNNGNNSMASENVDCSICMDRPRNSVIRSCNHFVTCYECARLLYTRKDPCPVCRKRIDDVIRVYTWYDTFSLSQKYTSINVFCRVPCVRFPSFVVICLFSHSIRHVFNL